MGRRRKNNKEKPVVEKECPRCKGSGEIVVKEKLENGGERKSNKTCTLRHGSGKKRNEHLFLIDVSFLPKSRLIKIGSNNSNLS